jgi:hypothetical protein
VDSILNIETKKVTRPVDSSKSSGFSPEHFELLDLLGNASGVPPEIGYGIITIIAW